MMAAVTWEMSLILPPSMSRPPTIPPTANMIPPILAKSGRDPVVFAVPDFALSGLAPALFGGSGFAMSAMQVYATSSSSGWS